MNQARKTTFASLLCLLFLFCTSALQPQPLIWAAAPQAAASPERVLVDATSGQDQRFAAAFQSVEKWIAEKAFPGAVLAIGQHGKLLALKSFGKMDYREAARPMPRDAIFDLASVSKIVGATTAAAILYDRKQLELDVPVVR